MLDTYRFVFKYTYKIPQIQMILKNIFWKKLVIKEYTFENV